MWPQPQTRTGSVSGSSAQNAKNGNVSGTAFVASPAATIQCLNSRHTLVPVSASFANVTVSHPTAGILSIAGTFSQTFFVVPPPAQIAFFTAVNLSTSVLTIGGAPVSYSVTIHNVGSTLPLVVMQAYLIQGTTYRAAGGTQVICTATRGELPSGDCTFSFIVSAANGAAAGNGNLVAGLATLNLQLWVGTSERTVESFAVPVTLQ